MFKVQNKITGRIVKDAISRDVLLFETKDHAENFAKSMTLNSIADKKNYSYRVVSA